MFCHFPASLQLIQTVNSSFCPYGMRTSPACGSRPWQLSSSWCWRWPSDCLSWLSFTGLLRAARYVCEAWALPSATSMSSYICHSQLSKENSGSQMKISWVSELDLNDIIDFNITKITSICYRKQRGKVGRKLTCHITTIKLRKKTQLTMFLSFLSAHLFLYLLRIQYALSTQFKYNPKRQTFFFFFGLLFLL